MKKNIFTMGFVSLILTFSCFFVSCGKTYKNSNWQLKIITAKWDKKQVGPGMLEIGNVVIKVIYLGSDDANGLTFPKYFLQDESGEKIDGNGRDLHVSYKVWKVSFVILPLYGKKLEKIFLHFDDFSPIPINIK